MTRSSKTANAMRKSTLTWSKLIRWLPLLTLLTIWMSSSGCSTVKVISADQAETFVAAGKPFTPAADGVFMCQARYQRYRRAVADKILELEPPPAK